MTPCRNANRRHPLAAARPRLPGGLVRHRFTEAATADAELAIEHGREFMEFFLFAGMRHG